MSSYCDQGFLSNNFGCIDGIYFYNGDVLSEPLEVLEV